MFLSTFSNLTMIYRPGKTNIVANALFRLLAFINKSVLKDYEDLRERLKDVSGEYLRIYIIILVSLLDSYIVEFADNQKADDYYTPIVKHLTREPLLNRIRFASDTSFILKSHELAKLDKKTIELL